MIADPSVVTKFRIFKVTCRLSVLDTFCPSIKAAVIQMNCYEVVRIRQMIMMQKVFFFLFLLTNFLLLKSLGNVCYIHLTKLFIETRSILSWNLNCQTGEVIFPIMNIQPA